jgi:outer membrane lipoprotein-sorting protein
VLVAVLGGGAITTALSASADASLPSRSAAQLLVDLQTAQLDGASGTVVERADLGLPSIPINVGGDGSAQFNSLVSGSHTLRVWYSGPDKARVALLGSTGESDFIHNGTDTWIWSSADNTAQHMKSTPDAPGLTPKVAPSGMPTDLPKTPQELADKLLATVGPTTTVSTDGSAVVAGHAAYELVLAPKDTSSLVSQVRIAIDGKAHVPTRVEVFAKSAPQRPVFEIAFTQVSFQRPDAGVFAFSPPPGAKITEGDNTEDATPGKPAVPGKDDANAPKTEPKTAVIGTGWTSVLVTRIPQDATAPAPQKPKSDSAVPSLESILGMLPEVHGSWGSGHVLQSHLFTALLTDDGRILVGAVSTDRLVAAAGDPAAALK